MLPNFYKVWILIDFQINQDFIARVLCINKAKPKLACHGKCHLSKKLQEQEKQEKKQVPQSQKDTFDTLFFSNSFTKVKGRYFHQQSLIGHPPRFYSFDFLDQIFHPPQFS